MPELAEAQATKYVTHNEALRIADALMMGVALSIGDTLPPVSPSDGDVYVLGTSCTGDWSGHDEEIAFYKSSAWEFVTPVEGWCMFAVDVWETFRYTGSPDGWTRGGMSILEADDFDGPSGSYGGEAGKVLKINAAEDAVDLGCDAYDIHCWVEGQPGASEVVLRQYITREIYFADDFAGSGGEAGTTASDTVVSEFSVQVDGVEKGTVTFEDSDTAVFATTGGAYTLPANSVLTIVAPAHQDSTLADLCICLHGVRTFSEE
jgi:hypothetical protein